MDEKNSRRTTIETLISTACIKEEPDPGAVKKVQFSFYPHKCTDMRELSNVLKETCVSSQFATL